MTWFAVKEDETIQKKNKTHLLQQHLLICSEPHICGHIINSDDAHCGDDIYGIWYNDDGNIISLCRETKDLLGPLVHQ